MSAASLEDERTSGARVEELLKQTRSQLQRISSAEKADKESSHVSRAREMLIKEIHRLEGLRAEQQRARREERKNSKQSKKTRSVLERAVSSPNLAARARPVPAVVATGSSVLPIVSPPASPTRAPAGRERELEQLYNAIDRMKSTALGPCAVEEMRVTLHHTENSVCKVGWRCWLRDGCGATIVCNNDLRRLYPHERPIRYAKPDNQLLWKAVQSFFDNCEQAPTISATIVNGEQIQFTRASALQLSAICLAWCRAKGYLPPHFRNQRAIPRGLFLLAAFYRRYIRYDEVQNEVGPDLPMYFSNESLALRDMRRTSTCPSEFMLRTFEERREARSIASRGAT